VRGNFLEVFDELAGYDPPLLSSLSEMLWFPASGNSTLTRVLPQVYAGNKEPVHESISSLIALLPEAAPSDKNNLLQLIGLVAKDKPRVGSVSVVCSVILTSHHLSSYLNSCTGFWLCIGDHFTNVVKSS